MPKHRQEIRTSLELYHRAEELIPGGVQLISRRPSRLANGVSPIYAAEAEGARILDVDGNTYLDWGSAIGTCLLGYRNPAVVDAVKRQIDAGPSFTLNHASEVELAEELVQTIPCAEMVRYAKGGGEGCTIAVRIARGATGRDKVLCCGYHGWHDWYLAANLSDESQLSEHLFSGIEPIGVPRALAGTTIPFSYGDLSELHDLLAQNAGEVACIIMEPMRSKFPPAGYLEGVREAATKAGAVLIFDEVTTGYRPALGGAQEYLGVTPDMAVFAKSISNGYPMGYVVGKREVMEPAAQMFISSTYWSDAIGTTAALATLHEMRRIDGVEKLQAMGRRFKARISEAIADSELDATCEGPDWYPVIKFNGLSPKQARPVSTLFVQEMSKAGIIISTAIFMTCAHSEADVEQTGQAATAAFKLIKSGLENDSLADLLEADVQLEPFRRLVS